MDEAKRERWTIDDVPRKRVVLSAASLLYYTRDWFIRRKVTWTCILNVRMRIITDAVQWVSGTYAFRSIFWGFRISKSASLATRISSQIRRTDNPSRCHPRRHLTPLYKEWENWNEKIYIYIYILYDVSIFLSIFGLLFSSRRNLSENCDFYQILTLHESQSCVWILKYI